MVVEGHADDVGHDDTDDEKVEGARVDQTEGLLAQVGRRLLGRDGGAVVDGRAQRSDPLLLLGRHRR